MNPAAAQTLPAATPKDFVSTRELERINWMEFREVVPARIRTVLLPTGTLEPQGGAIAPGEYYLISLGSGGATGAPLPPRTLRVRST